MSQLQRLRTLSFSHNSLTGSIPSEFDMLSSELNDGEWSGYGHSSSNHNVSGDGNSNGGQVPCCPDDQDIALFELDNKLGIFNSFRDVFSTSTSTLESAHPIGLDTSTHCISQPRAIDYSIEMDPSTTLCALARISICEDSSCKKVIRSYTGTGLSGDSFIVSVPSDQFCVKVVSGTFLACSGFYDYKFILTTLSIFLNLYMYMDIHCTCCTWVGITCDKGNVKSLKRTGYGLRGSIPTSMPRLAGLTSLDLSFNYITGSIPSSFYNLSNMNSLSLTGKISDNNDNEYFKLSSYYISLSDNQFSGSISLMSALAYLDLGHNNIEREVPYKLCSTTNGRNLTVNLKNVGQLQVQQRGNSI
eukprot:gene1452-2795_t